MLVNNNFKNFKKLWYNDFKKVRENMNTVNILVENMKKAHAEGCGDVKKVLETLAPDVFATKFPCFAQGAVTRAIYLFLSEREHIRLTDGDDEHMQWTSKIGEVGHSNNYSDQHPIKGIREIK